MLFYKQYIYKTICYPLSDFEEEQYITNGKCEMCNWIRLQYTDYYYYYQRFSFYSNIMHVTTKNTCADVVDTFY